MGSANETRVSGKFVWQWLIPLLAGNAFVLADEPLHVLIDQALTGISAPQCNDAEFLRRVSLDLNGVPPSADEVRAFLSDPTPDKRARAVDRLVNSVRYARHMAEVLDVMLMERRANTYISQDDWLSYLLNSVATDKPYNVLAKEILSATGSEPNLRAAARFYLDRSSEPNGITRDIGRIFLGRDFQCAQCHDHPLIDDYHQLDYHGLFAFVAGGYEQKIKEKQADKEVEVAYYSEKSAAEIEFESVFIKGTKHLTGPRLPSSLEVSEKIFLPGDEFEVAPAESVRPKLKFSRRQALVESLTDGRHAGFNENIANRLWAHMLGIGLVQPLDLHHSGNPPSHPALMKLLGEQFAGMNFSIKTFLKEIALSQAYQRSIDLPSDALAYSQQSAGSLGALEQDVAAAESTSLAASTEFQTALEAWGTAEQALLPAVAEWNAARAGYAEAKKKLDEARKAHLDAQTLVAAKENLAAALAPAVDRTNEAVAQVPDDADLKAAALKLAERLAQLQGEIPALKEAAKAKEAALAEPTAAVEAATAKIVAADEKARPLRAASVAAQEIVVAKRALRAKQSAALEHLRETLVEARRVAELKPAEDAVATTVNALPGFEQRLVESQAQVAAYQPKMAEQETLLAAAQASTATAQTELASVQAELGKRTEIVNSLTAAVTAAQGTLTLLPDDAALVTAVGKINERLSSAQTQLNEQQAAAAAATVLMNQVGEKQSQAEAALRSAQSEMSERTQAQEAAQKQLVEAQAQVESAKTLVATTRQSITEAWAQESVIAPLEPLTPEQLCWSIFQVTGVYKNYWAKHENELNASNPLSDEAKQDPGQVAARNRDIEQRVYNELKSYIATYVSLYGHAAGQPQTDFFATADQALFVANGGAILSWVNPSADNPAERIVKAENGTQAAEALYLGVLSRMPDESEIAAVTKYLEPRTADKPAAAAELVWSLITSVEFRFNH